MALLIRAMGRLASQEDQAPPYTLRDLKESDLRARFERAGLIDVRTGPLIYDGPYPAPQNMLDELHDIYLAVPGYAEVERDQHDALREALAAVVIEAYETGDELLIGRANYVLGRVAG